MSQPVIGDNSCSSKSSDNDQSRDDIQEYRGMMESSNQVDKRFIDLYKVKRAHEHGVRIEYGVKLEPSQHIEEEFENVPAVAKTI